MSFPIRILLLLALLLPAQLLMAANPLIDKLEFMTEAYPPYNFSKEGKLAGLSVDLLVRMLEEVGSSKGRDDIQLLPWPRGYKNLQEKPNTCLFSTTRTAERENLFRWVGPIIPVKNVLIAKKSRNLVIKDANDINQYTTGVIKDDVAEQLLLNAGVKSDRLQRVNASIQNIRKLKMGRIDFWAYPEMTALWQLSENGVDTAEYGPIFTLSEASLYYALHKDTDDAVIDALQKALDGLKASGEFEQILNKYR